MIDMTPTPVTGSPAPLARRTARRWPKGLRWFGRLSWPARISTIFLALLVLVAVLAPVLAPHDPNALDPMNSYGSARPGYWLGQDLAGRDILSRLVFGTRLALLGPVLVVILAVALGVPLGMLAGWRGGVFDSLISRTSDGLLAIPPLLLAIVITAALGGGFITAVIAISITYVPLMARVSRGLVLGERRKTYVDALHVQAFSTLRTVTLHVLPNMQRPLVAQAAVILGYAFIDLAGLSFLGLGVQPPTADWGAMLAEGRADLLTHPAEIVAASIGIAISVIAVNVLGDSLSNTDEGRLR